MPRNGLLLVAGALLTLAAAPQALAAGTAAAPAVGSKAIAVQPMTTVEGGVKSWVSLGIEQWSGETMYQIGYPVAFDGGVENGYFPFSELEFPLDVNMASLRVGVEFSDRIPVYATLKKPVKDPSDNMTDKDWITDSNPTRLDIYSESSISSFDATVFDIDAGYKFLRMPQIALSAGAGYLFQKFDYDVRLLHQWSPSGLVGYDYYGDGQAALNYEITYKVPYMQMRAEFRPIPKAEIFARIAYSPWAAAEDHDQHFLRNKDNKGDLDGDYLNFAVEGRYEFAPRWFVSAGYEYSYLDLDGTMTAEFYGIYDHTVTEHVESHQSVFFITAGYLFGKGAN